MEKESRKIGIFRMAFTFAGCFLGAGYVSGRELWQYFGMFGAKGFAGILISLFFLGMAVFFTIEAARLTGIVTFADLLVKTRRKTAKNIIDGLNIFVLAGIAMVMIAGISSLFEQLFSISRAVSAGVSVLLIALAACAGLEGMVTVFSFAVPVLVVTALFVCGIRIADTGIAASVKLILSEQAVSGHVSFSLAGGFLFSAINYACMNNLSSISTMAPLSERLKSRGSMIKGILLGCLFLFLIAAGILAAMNIDPESLSEEIPMAVIAGRISGSASLFYACLMFLAMYGVSVSETVAILIFFKKKVPAYSGHRKLFNSLLFLLIHSGSMLGFSDLISIIYPVFGYIGMGILVLTFIRYLQAKNRPSAQ